MFSLTRTLAPVLAAATVLSGTTLALGAGPAAATDARGSDTFQMATFNVLGGSHRAGRSGAARMGGAVSYLRKHRVAVVGFQEFEKKQYLAFRHQTGNSWGVVGAPSRSGKSLDPRNAIAYSRSRFQLVSHSSLAIPYFHGARMNIPFVRLRSRTTGATFVMLNTHNPADVHGRAQRYRDEATRREVALVHRLRAQGDTVFVTGDMNEKAPYFCKMTRSGAMHSASGGRVGSHCLAPRINGIDWIFGSHGVRFRNWTADTSTRARGISDHPMVVAQVTLPR